MDWFACHTQSNKEQLASRSLKERGFEVFWPHTTHWVGTGHKASSRLVKRSWLSRYLFVRTFKENLWAVNHAMGISAVVHAPGGEPYPIPTKAMEVILSASGPNGEVFVGKTPRAKPKYRAGDLIRITDEKSPLFGLYVQAKKVLDNGTIYAIFSGSMVGGGKLILTDSIEGEIVKAAVG